MPPLIDDSETHKLSFLVADEIESIRSVLGPEIPEDDIVRALSAVGNNPDRAIGILLDSKAAKTEVVSETPVNFVDSSCLELKGVVRREEREMGIEKDPVLMPLSVVKKEDVEMGIERDPILIPHTVVKKEEQEMGIEINTVLIPKTVVKKEESKLDIDENEIKVKKEEVDGKNDGLNGVTIAKEEAVEEFEKVLAKSHCAPYLNPRPITAIRPPEVVVTDRRIQALPVGPDPAELAEFPEEDDWFLVGKTYVSGLSTTRGKRKLDAGEIVYFTFPKSNVRKQFGRQWVSAKTAAASSEIVRFSTKKSGEIGRLPTEWSRCIIPLVNASKVKVRARCVIAPLVLSLMQEIMLYVSFYIHSSIFTEGDKSAWKLVTPTHVDCTVHPLPTLFKLLKIKPSQKAEFTPEELDTRKRSLNLKDDDDNESEPIVGLAKRRKGGETWAEQGKDEQAISEASLNKLVGAVESYDLKEAEPPSTLKCSLWPYQKQALHWMSDLEKGLDVEQAEKTLHPCWAAYRVCDKRATAMYVNIFSGEATTEFPSATQMARGGILADAMGLGKTVMTIALVLSSPRGRADDQDSIEAESNSEEDSGRASQTGKSSSIRGGTLIVCPMALLGQWKDELETHSEPGSISIFVHYGGDRTNDPQEIAKHHVVLTTYGVLAASLKNDLEKASIFHRIDWYRVVLDEAHNIKSPKASVSQSAIALSSHCRWCLTGTPIQNNLEDLYSLLCFLHVQPWCNWAWWQKLIQKPYENGDERGLRLVKAILKPLMLRRTKNTKDKDGRPILVLPPANVQIIECEHSEAERDFYEALFKKSKVRFDQFVAQGKVLHNYASILELLLRLRQCCNHPFLVLSRGDTQQYTDLDKLACHFLYGSNSSSVPSKAYVEEVVEGIRRGEVTECPICLESASDDPVLTLCAHRMCRECLLSSWRSPAGGPCPICRKVLSKADLITCPTESRFQVDVVKNWKESSKVTELIRCLESIRKLGTGEKSIVFSQWTSFLDLLEIPLTRKKIGFLRFDGKLSQKNREKVLKEFSESKTKPVLLMSLKAGGVGLNLTAASNVFLMDPWWNPAVEEQAIMRIHRIGQKREVRVRRFIVKDTVEERMQQVQARKQRMIAGALTDEEVRSSRIEELKMLFR